MNTLVSSKCQLQSSYFNMNSYLNANSYLSVFEVVRDNESGIASDPRNDGRERSGPRKYLSSYLQGGAYV